MRKRSKVRYGVTGALGLLALSLAHTGYSFQGDAAPTVPPLVLENFEAATIGARPYLWKEGKQVAAESKIGADRSALDGDDANKALKFEYTFPTTFDPAQGVEAGPMTQALPGSLTALTMMVHGDGSKNAIAVRLKDKQGETFEWRVPVTWMDWKKTSIPLSPATALKGRGNGMLDYPLQLEVVRVARLNGGARKGEIMVDNLTAECKFAKVTTLYDTEGGVKLDGWKANKNRSTIGLLADSLVPRNGKDVAVLKLEYEYENSPDSSVEYSKTIPAGEGHGTLIAEVYGDGSNNILRFRLLDGQDRPWQATWASILVDWSGWKTLYVDTHTLRQTGAGNFDPSAEMEKFPIKFYSILVDDCSGSDALPGVESGRKGEVYLGRLLFCSEK